MSDASLIGLFALAALVKGQKQAPSPPPPPPPPEEDTGASNLIRQGSGVLGTITTIAAAAGVSAATVVGAVAAIAAIVVFVVTAVARGVTDAQWVSDALRKGAVRDEDGQNELRDDLESFAVQLAQKLIAEGWAKSHAAAFSSAVALSCNDCMRLAVDAIPWANAATGWTAHREYWAKRAMFFWNDVGFEEEVLAKLEIPITEYAQTPAAELDRAAGLGAQFGKLLLVWMWGKKQMIEPWHYDWTRKAVDQSVLAGFTGWTIGNWDVPSPFAAVLLRMGVQGLSWEKPRSDNPAFPDFVYQFGPEDQTMRLVAAPFVLDVLKSTPEAPVISLQSPDAAPPPQSSNLFVFQR